MNDPNFVFDGYRVRPVSEQDRVYLDLLISSDDYHCGRMTPDFFLKPNQGEDSWAFEDDKGNIVFYFKTSAVIRLAVQFSGWGTREYSRRNQRALMRGLRWIEDIFRRHNFTEIVFDTEGPELTRFARRHMGFAPGYTMSKPISPSAAWATLATDDLKKGGVGDVRT